MFSFWLALPLQVVAIDIDDVFWVTLQLQHLPTLPRRCFSSDAAALLNRCANVAHDDLTELPLPLHHLHGRPLVGFLDQRRRHFGRHPHAPGQRRRDCLTWCRLRHLLVRGRGLLAAAVAAQRRRGRCGTRNGAGNTIARAANNGMACSFIGGLVGRLRLGDIGTMKRNSRSCGHDRPLLAVVQVDPQLRRPLRDFAPPIRQQARRHNNEGGVGELAAVLEVLHKCDGLQCLAQAHVVGEDATQTVPRIAH
mmetsp:Transcript_65614/g.183475  ORF Transcript_65614/g.183475 Transcript_65614/m.183475 type:complete len:251 (-) Transcript_65614:1978-2730(-)